MKCSTILVLAGAALVSALPGNSQSWENMSCPPASTMYETKYMTPTCPPASTSTKYETKYETVTYTQVCTPKTITATQYKTEYQTQTAYKTETSYNKEYVTSYVTQPCAVSSKPYVASSSSWGKW